MQSTHIPPYLPDTCELHMMTQFLVFMSYFYMNNFGFSSENQWSTTLRFSLYFLGCVLLAFVQTYAKNCSSTFFTLQFSEICWHNSQTLIYYTLHYFQCLYIQCYKIMSYYIYKMVISTIWNWSFACCVKTRNYIGKGVSKEYCWYLSLI